MGIPDEDLGPVWLRDYGNGASIEADIQRLEEFAAQLDAEVRENYVPHMEILQEDMMVELPSPAAEFSELASFMQTHQSTQQNTTNIVHTFRDATGGFAYAAQKVSADYGNADAFSAARVADVEAAFDQTAVAPVPPETEPAPDGTNDTGGVS